tara:strand:+ start:740 stop:1180 length:441 start_codon:yes stop_codon:yes gene_type:complete
MKVKSFKGRLADGGQERIRLSTNDGKTGYKVKKFQTMTVSPGIEQHESVTQIFAEKVATVPTGSATVDFTNPLLLAANTYISGNASAEVYNQQVIFDNVKVNQDIYITHTENDGSSAINYYVELEQVKLDLNEATVATLKDMRGRE